MNKITYISALTTALLAFGIQGKAQFGGNGDGRTGGFGEEGPNDTSATQAVDSEDRLPTRIIAWQFDPATMHLDTTTVDTSLDYHYFYSPVLDETFSAEHLGSPGQPYQSHLFMHRPRQARFLFFRHYGAYAIRPQNTIYHNTTTPFTQIQFSSLFQREPNEQTFRITHTQNVSPYLNLGFRFKRQMSHGIYQNQKLGNDAISLNANMHRKKYQMHANTNFNKFRVTQSGGLTSPEVMDSAEYTESTFPVKLDGARSVVFNYGLYVHQMYLFGEKEKSWIDTLRPDSLLYKIDSFLVPRSGLFHEFDYQSYKYQYFEAPMQYQAYRDLFSDSAGYVPTWDPDTTRDSLMIRYVRNRAGLHLDKNSGSPVDFSLSAGGEVMLARYNLYRMSYREFSDTSYWAPKRGMDSMMVNYDLSASLGLLKTKRMKLRTDGRYYFTGYRKGDFHGRFYAEYRYAHDSAGRDLSRFIGKAYMGSQQAPFSMQTHYTNYYSWHYDFKPEKRQSINLEYLRKKWRFKGGLYFARLQDFLYFDHEAKPAQAGRPFTVVSAYADKTFRAGAFRFGNKLAVQQTNDEYLRLPLFVIRHATWADLFFFDENLRFQPGIALHFFTAYQADAFYPMTNQFYLQDEYTIGSYPNLQAFINFQVAEARIFISATNLGAFFLDSDYFYAPTYPIYPFMLKWGISWMFFD